MREVEAVKDEATIQKIAVLLDANHSRQMADVWELGINLALRISDLLGLRFDDVKGEYVSIVEGKTGKRAEIKLNSKARTIIERIRHDHPGDTYIFQSRRSRVVKTVKPISRQAVAKAFQEVGEMDSVNVQLGSHSMRKTRGYHLYKKTNDIARVMRMLRHSSEAITLRYIGVTKKDIDQDFEDLEL